MATWVDFDSIKAAVSLEQVFMHYNLLDRMARKGKRVSGLCPFHPDAKTKSFKADLEKNLWNCFGACNRGGDLIDLVCIAEGIDTGNRTRDRRQAALLLQEWFSITPSAPTQAKTTDQRRPRNRQKTGRAGDSTGTADTEHQEEATTPEAASAEQQSEQGAEATPSNQPLTFTFRHLDPKHPYLAEQGLTDETIATFGLGHHAGRGIMHGRIVIPLHNEAGELVAFAGRWPGNAPPEDEPKYKFPPNFRKSLVLYNLHRAREHAGDGLIVVEGFFSGVFTLWQMGRKNVVAIMGNALSEVQERLIVQTVGQRGRVLLMFDDDEAGRNGMADAAARLAPQIFVRTRPLA